MKHKITTAFAFFMLILVVGCRRDTRVPYSFESLPTYNGLKDQLDFTHVETITGKENVVIYMVRYKADTHKIYAASSTGKELLYTNRMVDQNNGSIDLVKDGEAIEIVFSDGIRTIKDAGSKSYTARTMADFHGGTGFCQREAKESFGDCFKAESDEFCDSFFSCVALATQPTVAILIGIACSCSASTSK